MDDATGAIPAPLPAPPRPHSEAHRNTASTAARSDFDAELEAARLADVARGEAELAYHLAYTRALDEPIALMEGVDVAMGLALGPAYDAGQIIGYTAMGDQQGAKGAWISLALPPPFSTIKDAIDFANAAEGIADVIRERMP